MEFGVLGIGVRGLVRFLEIISNKESLWLLEEIDKSRKRYSPVYFFYVLQNVIRTLLVFARHISLELRIGKNR